jgi:hypothetical protein
MLLLAILLVLCGAKSVPLLLGGIWAFRRVFFDVVVTVNRQNSSDFPEESAVFEPHIAFQEKG